MGRRCTVLVWIGSLCACLAQAQTPSDSLFHAPSQTVGNIPKGTTDIEVDQEGNLYLLQTAKHRLYKYFEMTDYDSVQAIGGKGLGDEGFNFPSKITVPNRQSVFMLDQMNRRLVQMNTNLRVLKDINFLTLQVDLPGIGTASFWPISFAVGPSGELYFLNQDDIQIYKFATSGSLERAFGGLDYGAGSLADPSDIVLSANNMVFAVDSSNQKLTIFDLFGTYQYSLSFPLDFRWKRMVTLDDNLLFLGDHSIFLYNSFSRQGETIRFPDGPKLIDAAASRDFIYLLWENRVDLFPFSHP